MPVWVLRFLPWVAGGIAAAWLFVVVNGWRKDSIELPKVQQQYAVYREGVETAQRVREEVSSGFQAEIAALRANQRPAPVVRLCQPAPVVPSDRTPSGSDGSGAAPGQLPPGTAADAVPGRDIGSELFRIADRADELTAQLRACQAFVERVRTKPQD